MAKKMNMMDPLSTLDDSDSDSDDQQGDLPLASADTSQKISKGSSLGKVAQAPVPAKKHAMNFETLSKHGFKGGPSVLFVPPPKEDSQHSYEWGQGKRKDPDEEPESFEERERLRLVANDRSIEAAALAIAGFEANKKLRKDAAEERRALSFNQKEKRKREMGQASKGKNYVEEEKRLLRDQGVYSGFDK
eukprot:jgi/Mesen1/7987/ME000425S07186